MRYRGRAPLRIDLAGGWTDLPFYAEERGGAVVSAAITRYVMGSLSRPDVSGLLHVLRGDRSYVSYTTDLPVDAGLGSLGAQTVLWLALMKTSISNTSDRREIADMACRITDMLGILGGKQDQYASALGGIHFLSFSAGVHVERIEPRLSFVDDVRSRLVLVYTGRSRVARVVVDRVSSRYRAGEPAVAAALAGLKRTAEAMRAAILAEDLGAMGGLLLENWSYQKELDESVSNRELDGVFELALRNGALGGKACGMGGGGCVVFLSGPADGERLRSALRGRHLTVIDFDFDSYGVFVTKG